MNVSKSTSSTSNTVSKSASNTVENQPHLERVALLEYITKFASPEIADFFPSETVRRYALQSVARDILPDERVSRCLRYPTPNAVSVNIHADAANRRAYYSNLIVCGSVWHCPVCAAKVTEGRRRELSQALENWQNKGNLVVMATYTLAHGINHTLAANLGVLKQARRFLKSGKKWQAMQTRFGIVGTISAQEITWGQHGWHPHVHELLFIQKDKLAYTFSNKRLEDELGEMWLKSLARFGGSALMGIGVVVTSANKKIADYVQKMGAEDEIKPTWTLAHEMTKYPSKKAKKKDSITPQGLLFAAFQGQHYARVLYREYGKATKGRSQLHFSKGLADLLGLEGIRDDIELAEDNRPELPVLLSLNLAQWRKVIGVDNSNGFRGQLLDLAKSGDRQLVGKFLEAYGVALD